MKSSFMSLKVKDFLHSFYMAIGTPVFLGLGEIIKSGSMPNAGQVKILVGSGLAAGLFNIAKRYFSNSNDDLLKSEQPKV